MDQNAHPSYPFSCHYWSLQATAYNITSDESVGVENCVTEVTCVSRTTISANNMSILNNYCVDNKDNLLFANCVGYSSVIAD